MKNIDFMIMLVLFLVIMYFYKLNSCPQNYYFVNGYCKPCVGGSVIADSNICLCPSGTSLNSEGTVCIPDYL
jgi:hypothetical protein